MSCKDEIACKYTRAVDGGGSDGNENGACSTTRAPMNTTLHHTTNVMSRLSQAFLLPNLSANCPKLKIIFNYSFESINYHYFTPDVMCEVIKFPSPKN